MKKTYNFESKSKKQRVKCNNEKENAGRKCTGNNRKRSNSYKRNSSRTCGKSCSKVDGKRYYSTSDVTKQSIFSVPRNRKSFSNSISDITLGINVNKRFYTSNASYSKDKKDQRQTPSCKEPKMKDEKKEEIKKKCVKGPAKCMSRKKTIDKTQICQSTKKDNKFYESENFYKKEKTSKEKELKRGKINLI